MTSMSLSVVHRDPDILGGTPVFVGTRVPVRTLLNYLSAGEWPEPALRSCSRWIRTCATNRTSRRSGRRWSSWRPQAIVWPMRPILADAVPLAAGRTGSRLRGHLHRATCAAGPRPASTASRRCWTQRWPTSKSTGCWPTPATIRRPITALPARNAGCVRLSRRAFVAQSRHLPHHAPLRRHGFSTECSIKRFHPN